MLPSSSQKQKTNSLQACVLTFFKPLSYKHDVRYDCNNPKLVLPALKSSRAGTFGLQPEFLQGHLLPPSPAVHAVLTPRGCAGVLPGV